MREIGGRIPIDYALGDEQGLPLGLLPLYKSAPSNPHYALDHILRGLPPDLVPPSPFFGGALSGYRADLPTVSSASAKAAARELLASARRIAGPTNSVIVPYLTTTAARLIADDTSVNILLEGVDAWIDVPSSPFEEYVDSLRADDRRTARKDMMAFREAGLQTSVEPLEDCVNSFASLAAQSHRKYGVWANEKDTITYLRIIAEVFGDDSVVLAARDGSRLVGGVLGLVHEDALYLREVGFEYSAAPESRAYFVLCFHLSVQYAASTSRRRVYLGLVTDGTKRSRGGRLEPLWTALINTKVIASQVDQLNGERLLALADVIGTRQRDAFLDQVGAVLSLAGSPSGG